MFDKRKLRLLLRKGEANFITQALMSKTWGVKKEDAKQALQKLEDLGYIERIGIDGCWGVAVRGKLYASQTFKKLYKVNSLHQHLSSFRERLALINSSQEFTHFINRVKIISEYPIVSRSHGVKIIYSLTKKKMSEKEYQKISRKLIAKSKKRFYNMIDRLFYPETAIYETLKSRSHILKLRKVEDEDIENIKGYLLFDAKTISA
jgi:DNA-binding Lrp family transcriptional regulator